MQITPLEIDGVFLLEPQVFEDERGLFFESFNRKAFEGATGLSPTFLQDNHSQSNRGVLRGLHFQLPPFAQGKLVRVVRGEIFDVAVDLRSDSPSFGQWISEVISADNRKQIWIPEGFAHGFLSMDDGTEVLYKTNQVYAAEYEASIHWDDAEIGVGWPLKEEITLSAKDESASTFEDIKRCLPQGSWRHANA